MSSQRGNVKKTRAPKYQNKTGFKNNLHDKTKKTQMINNLETWGLCSTCKGVIDWKIKYKKYKPLTQPKTCVKCGLKTIKRAYYTVCQSCSESLKLCGKCGKTKEIVQRIGLSESEESSQQAQLDQEVKMLPERKRRAFLRNQAAGNYKDEECTDEDEESTDEDEEKECTDEDQRVQGSNAEQEALGTDEASGTVPPELDTLGTDVTDVSQLDKLPHETNMKDLTLDNKT